MKDTRSMPIELDMAQRTIPAMLRHARENGAGASIVIGDVRLPLSDLAGRAARMSSTLAEAGVAPGDRVAILAGNRIELLDLILGCAWLGAIAVPLNRALRGGQLHHVLANSGARILAIDPDLIPVLAFLERDGLELDTVWSLPGEASAKPGDAGTWQVQPLPPPGAIREPFACAPSDTALIIYTSGTTGPSKGVCCPHAQFYWWAYHSSDIIEITSDDVLLTTLPLYHVNALLTVFCAMLTGASLVVLDRFSASGFSKSLVDHGATVTYLLGAMASILLTTPETQLDKQHKVTRALAPGVPERFHADFTRRFGMHLIDGYGSTETCFIIGDRVGEGRPGAMGRLREGFAAIVADDHDNEVPPGTPGELLVRPQEPFSIAAGYFRMPEQTVAAWRNLWFHTGDRVYRDAEGYFYFMDRLKDAIRRRGENISAFEVEQVMLSHPAISVVAVYPVASEHGEDEVMASIVLKPGCRIDCTDLLDFCQPRMAHYAVPRFLRFADDLPRTENGKVQKFKLRELGVTADTWDREAVGYKIVRDARSLAS